jgi:hypothetical protein
MTRGSRRLFADSYLSSAGVGRSIPRLVLANVSLRLLVALLGLSTTVVLAFGGTGDYPQDAGPAVTAVANGDFLAGLGGKALMGAVSILIRAPFVALTRAASLGELWQYRVGAVVCFAPAAALGVWLASRLSARPQSDWVPAVFAVLVVANPVTVAAVAYGHPEEVLTAALAVGAVVLAARERTIAAGLVLALALASKQWAFVAVVPTIVAAPRSQRLKLVAILGAVAAVVTLPVLLANPTAFVHLNQQAATTPLSIGRTNVWFLLAHPHTIQVHVPAGLPSDFVLYRIPEWVARWSHPAIVVAAVPFAALFARRRTASIDALALLAVAFLLRCVLDPVDNAYYHVPLVVALLAWEALSRGRRLPIVSMLTCAALWITFDHVEPVARPAVTNMVYLSWTTVLFAYLVYVIAILPSRGGNTVGSDAAVTAYPFARP